MIEIPIWLAVTLGLAAVAQEIAWRRLRRRREAAEERYLAARRGLLRVQEGVGALGSVSEKDAQNVREQIRVAWDEIREIEPR